MGVFGASFIPLRRSLQQFLDRFNVTGRKSFGPVLPAIERAPHFLGKFFGKGKGQNHAVVGFAIQESMKVSFQCHAEFPDRKLLFALAVLHNPEFEYA